MCLSRCTASQMLFMAKSYGTQRSLDLSKAERERIKATSDSVEGLRKHDSLVSQGKRPRLPLNLATPAMRVTVLLPSPLRK